MGDFNSLLMQQRIQCMFIYWDESLWNFTDVRSNLKCNVIKSLEPDHKPLVSTDCTMSPESHRASLVDKFQRSGCCGQSSWGQWRGGRGRGAGRQEGRESEDDAGDWGEQSWGCWRRSRGRGSYWDPDVPVCVWQHPPETCSPPQPDLRLLRAAFLHSAAPVQGWVKS